MSSSPGTTFSGSLIYAQVPLNIPHGRPGPHPCAPSPIPYTTPLTTIYTRRSLRSGATRSCCLNSRRLWISGKDLAIRNTQFPKICQGDQRDLKFLWRPNVTTDRHLEYTIRIAKNGLKCLEISKMMTKRLILCFMKSQKLYLPSGILAENCESMTLF